MNRMRFLLFTLPVVLLACSSVDNGGTIAMLRDRQIEIREEKIDGGLEKAMAGYQRFLTETPDSVLVPEAIRRLADLKVEKEYGLITEGEEKASSAEGMSEPQYGAQPQIPSPRQELEQHPVKQEESKADFEDRAVRRLPVEDTDPKGDEQLPAVDDLERAGPLEAIALYRKLLKEYPLYERNDQVLYQMSRAYEELGRVEEAMKVMDRMVREYPKSRYLDEVQFRRAEYFFSHRKYLDAEDAYQSIVDIGVGSSYFQLALYKMGWTFYKQELYEEALHKFIALLDYHVSVGYDFEQRGDETERKRMEDTFRVISLSFSYLGGADSVVGYFSSFGKRSYEDRVYSRLGEYYLSKRRYSDAVETYDAFVARNPFHRKSPNFHMRVIEINMAGGFPSLVIESKKTFATRYGLEADYWEHFEPGERPEVLDDLKTNLTDLANHYHALYQNPKKEEKKQVNFEEARHWYRQFLVSFPSVDESPAINYQMADLLLENHSFDEAAVEYEKTAYDYPEHEKSSKAGYAAVYAFRQYLDAVPKAEREPVMREAVRSSLQFAETFPEHEKAAVVLDAAAEDLYNMGDHEEALAAARKLIDVFSKADKNVRRSAWLVVAHSTYELQRYGEAESAYMHVLDLLPEEDESRTDLVDNLAASIYKQGEQANDLEDFRAAAEHFLRIGLRAPTSSIRPTAEYDAAAALIRLEDWDRAASVLTGFRDHFPGHELQPEVTKKIAHVYRENGELALAATEYERIERESEDDDVRREALLIAAKLHGEAGSKDRMLEVYRRYVEYFPKPVEINLETRNKIAEIFRERTDQDKYLDELRQIVAIESAAGNGQTDRTRYLASKAALVLTERQYERFVDVRLVQPFEDNLRKKQERMKAATKGVNALLDYEIGEVTAAATFYLAEIYAHFSKALMESERPKGLTPLEMEQYELAIEDQAYPFEEKGIAVHERNLELISVGIYNEWIEKSLQKLARSVPARYARTEEESDVLTRLDTFTFASGEPTSTVQEESPDQVAETLPQMASDKSDAVTEGPHGENQ